MALDLSVTYKNDKNIYIFLILLRLTEKSSSFVN